MALVISAFEIELATNEFWTSAEAKPAGMKLHTSGAGIIMASSITTFTG
jgi:hypothetical protein